MGERGFEYLEGHIPSQPLVAGAVYFPHPSRTYLFENPIVAEDFPNHAKAEAACVGMLGRVRLDVNWRLQIFAESTPGTTRMLLLPRRGSRRFINVQNDLMERLLCCQLPHPPHDPDCEGKDEQRTD